MSNDYTSLTVLLIVILVSMSTLYLLDSIKYMYIFIKYRYNKLWNEKDINNENYHVILKELTDQDIANILVSFIFNQQVDYECLDYIYQGNKISILILENSLSIIIDDDRKLFEIIKDDKSITFEHIGLFCLGNENTESFKDLIIYLLQVCGLQLTSNLEEDVFETRLCSNKEVLLDVDDMIDPMDTLSYKFARYNGNKNSEYVYIIHDKDFIYKSTNISKAPFLDFNKETDIKRRLFVINKIVYSKKF